MVNILHVKVKVLNVTQGTNRYKAPTNNFPQVIWETVTTETLIVEFGLDQSWNSTV